jgi:hypothetical protein
MSGFHAGSKIYCGFCESLLTGWQHHQARGLATGMHKESTTDRLHTTHSSCVLAPLSGPVTPEHEFASSPGEHDRSWQVY